MKFITVTELNQAVATELNQVFERVYVTGEVSSISYAPSGHCYFSIKDTQASVKAVMFAGVLARLGFRPKVGDKLEITAKVTLYVPRGDYQLQVLSMAMAGQGDLDLAFKQLVAQLSAEGLFDVQLKKPLPKYVNTIGLITSANAAALQDVLTTLARRSPFVKIILYPALVQGKTAAQSLRAALKVAIERHEVDLLLIVRGGGSKEDLWCFNDPDLARDVVACPIPIISGVGHEIDTTICDYAADVRAPTPTAAAELACASIEHLLQSLTHSQSRLGHLFEHLMTQLSYEQDTYAQRLDRAWLDYYQKCQQTLSAYQLRLISPKQQLEHIGERLTALTHRLAQVAKKSLQDKAYRLLPYQQFLKRYHAQLPDRQKDLSFLRAKLEHLNPQAILSRGYAIVFDEAGYAVRQASELTLGQSLRIQLAEGQVTARVDECHNEEKGVSLK